MWNGEEILGTSISTIFPESFPEGIFADPEEIADKINAFLAISQEKTDGKAQSMNNMCVFREGLSDHLSIHQVGNLSPYNLKLKVNPRQRLEAWVHSPRYPGLEFKMVSS